MDVLSQLERERIQRILQSADAVMFDAGFLAMSPNVDKNDVRQVIDAATVLRHWAGRLMV